MPESRRHPDLFNAHEALEYLHKSPEDHGFLDTAKRSHGLRGAMFGQEMLYHRRHLDALADRLFGMDRDMSTPLDKLSDLSRQRLKIGAGK